MISPEEAWSRIESAIAERPRRMPWKVRRGRARGLVLSAPVEALADLPADDLAALDGFAFAGAPTDGRGHAVVARLLAGSGGPATAPLAPGTAARIMTGAPVPAGADCVVGFEDVDAADGFARMRAAAPAGAAIRRRGEVVRAGEPLLPAGARLGAAALSLLASQGIEEVDCVPPPRVEVLVTGDEVVRAGAAGDEAAPAPGSVRDSHSDFLAAELARLGLEPIAGDLVRDDAEALRTRLAAALERADVVLTCGGVSMGDADLVPGTLSGLGAATLFHGVAIQPGKPLLAATRGDRLIFGLPGNPGSVMTSFWLLVKPALDQLAGGEGRFWDRVRLATLSAPLGPGKGRDRFVPATLSSRGGTLLAQPRSPKGSHDLVAFAGANALLRVRPGDPPREAGAECEILEI